MRVYILDQTVKDKYPGLSLYGAIVNNVEVTKQLQFVTSQKKKIQADFREKYNPDNISEVPQVEAIRKLFEIMEINLDDELTAVQNLTKLLYRGGLPNINSVVDSCNIASIGTLMPIGVFDADTMLGNVVFRLSTEGETYDPIGMQSLTLKSGIMVLADDKGIFARPMYKDSTRTMIRLETRNILIFTVQYPPISDEDVNKALDLAVQIVTTSSKGEIGERVMFV